MQILIRIQREAEEALEKLNTIKARLTERYKHQVELAEGKNIGAKKPKVLAGLALEESKALRNIDKFLIDTLFPSYKKIASTDKEAKKVNTEEEEKTKTVAETTTTI